jgi:hypothetical protein
MTDLATLASARGDDEERRRWLARAAELTSHLAKLQLAVLEGTVEELQQLRALAVAKGDRDAQLLSALPVALFRLRRIIHGLQGRGAVKSGGGGEGHTEDGGVGPGEIIRLLFAFAYALLRILRSVALIIGGGYPSMEARRSRRCRVSRP